MQADLYFFSAVAFSLSNWDKFGHVFAYRAISRGRFRPEKALTSFKSSTSFTIDFPVIAVNFLPILRPVRQKSRFYFFVMCLLINKKPRCGWNRALKLTVTHTVRLRFCYFFIFTQTLVQLVKRDMVTAVIYCYITTQFHYAGET